MSSQIDFSIIIPCYNHANYVSICIDSLIRQSHNSWEAICVNDGSTDHTENTILNYAQIDNRIKYFYKQNGGLSSARNFGLKKISGAYIIFLDADDYLLSNCLSSIYKRKQVQLSDMYIYGYKHVINKSLNERSVLPVHSSSIIPNIYFNNLGPVHSVCIKSDIVFNKYEFDEGLKSCEDWDFWMKISTNIKSIECINEVLVAYRTVDNSMSRNAQVLYQHLILILNRGWKLYELNEVSVSYKKFIDSFQHKLSLCIGVLICQNKVDEAVTLFNLQCQTYQVNFDSNYFKYTSSYLTFRYVTEVDEALYVLKSYKNNYIQFFKLIGYEKAKAYKTIWQVFKPQYAIVFKKKYGLLGLCLFQVINRMLKWN